MQRVWKIATSAIVASSLILIPSTASAYVTSGLLVYLDATNSSSFTNVSSPWQDLTSSNVDGTFVGAGISYDSASQSIVFPGGPHGTAWIKLDTSTEKFNDFRGGFSIEFEGEFGAERSNWERIFDFSEDTNATPGDDETDYSFWLGHYYSSNELALEIFNNGVRSGYCHTSTGSTGANTPTKGTALGATGSREFAKWIVTIGTDDNNTCKIYKNGVALPVRLTDGTGTYAANDGSTAGANFTLPPVFDRESALIGGSNFNADRDFEGRIRYIRVYDQTLTPAQAAENAGISSAGSNNDSSTNSSESSSLPGIFLTVTGRPGREFEGSQVIYGSYAIPPNAAYQIILQSISSPSMVNRILATGRVNDGGHLEQTVTLPVMPAGSYKIILTGTGPGGERLQLTNHVNVDSAGMFSHVSSERLQPVLN